MLLKVVPWSLIIDVRSSNLEKYRNLIAGAGNFGYVFW